MDPYVLFLDVCHTRLRYEEKWVTNFRLRENKFFWKVCFYWPRRSQRIHFYHLHNFCQNTLWSLINCCLTYFMCNNTRKSRPKFFYHWKECIFWKLSVFNRLLDPKKALINSKIDVKEACGPSKIDPWCLSHSMIRGKTRKKHLSPWKQLYFEMFVSIDILGPKEMIWFLRNACQKTLWTLTNCSLTLVMFDKKKKNRPKSFHHWKDCLSFRNFLFLTAC